MTASLSPFAQGLTALSRSGERADLEDAVGVLPALGAVGPGERYGLRTLTVLWLQADKSPHTRRAYFADLAEWLTWCDGAGLSPLQARRADVDAWKSTLTVVTADGGRRPASPATVARRLAGVSSWYRYLISNDVTDRNPIGAVRRPRTSDTPPLPALSLASAVRLLTHAEARADRNGTEPSRRDLVVISLLLHTGVRVSALTGAQVTDLDRDGGHHVLRYDRKGGGRDLVPLPEPAYRAVQRYLRARADRVGGRVESLTGPLLVTTPHHAPDAGGAPLSQRDVWRTLRTLAAQAELPEAGTITPHTTRRTAGTLLLAHGVPVQAVADLLGHRDIRTTRDRYDAHRHKLDSSPAYDLARILSEIPGPDPVRPPS